MHQILKITVIAASHRITGLVRISHGIQECVKRAFNQFYKRIFQWKFPGATQYTVFQNMCHTCAVLWRCAECNIKDLVLIVILDEHYSGSCFFVAQKPAFGMNILKVFLLQDLICVQMIWIHLITS